MLCDKYESPLSDLSIFTLVKAQIIPSCKGLRMDGWMYVWIARIELAPGNPVDCSEVKVQPPLPDRNSVVRWLFIFFYFQRDLSTSTVLERERVWALRPK